jgi:hypothetical protein
VHWTMVDPSQALQMESRIQGTQINQTA